MLGAVGAGGVGEIASAVEREPLPVIALETKSIPRTDAPPSPAVRPSADAATVVRSSEPTAEALLDLRTRLRRALDVNYTPENALSATPLDVIHSVLAYRQDARVIVPGRVQNAIDWLCANGPCRELRVLSAPQGQLQAATGAGIQGQSGQLLAAFALAGVERRRALEVDGHQFAVTDLIAHEQRSCRANQEQSFKLVALAHYASNQTWRSADGDDWSVPRLLAQEIDAPLLNGACGGTHRAFAISYAIRVRERLRDPLEGEWLRAKEYEDSLHNYTIRLQNADGSFSTNGLAGRAEDADVKRRLQTTGHIVDWLASSLPNDQLLDARFMRSVSYLANLLLETAEERLESGTRGHALRGLAIYEQRVFGARGVGLGAHISAGGATKR